MEDILFNLPYASDTPVVYIQGTDSIEDICAYEKKRWQIFLRQDVKTIKVFQNEDLPKSVQIVVKLTAPADIMHVVGPVATPALILEAVDCSAKVVRVGGTTQTPLFSSYADGLRRSAMALRGLGYDVYRLREWHGIPCHLVPDERAEGDAATVIGFADPETAKAALKMSRITKGIIDTLTSRLNPRALSRAETYIGLLEDALLALQKPSQG